MGELVDFENLRTITDGDVELEAELFRTFITSAAQCVEGLRAAVAGNNDDEWRRHAHALKGAALNLGAKPLGELCKTAQDSFTSSAEDKRRMLAQIDDAFGQVRALLESHI